MRKWIQLLAMVILITSCKSAVTAPKDVVETSLLLLTNSK